MASAFFCSMCNREVHVSEGDESACPVCSASLLLPARGTEEDSN